MAIVLSMPRYTASDLQASTCSYWKLFSSWI